MSGIDVFEFEKGLITPPPSIPTQEAIDEEAMGFTTQSLKSFNQLIDQIKRKQLPPKRLKELTSALAMSYESEDASPDEADYDETFDMEKEVSEVLKTVKLLRKSILTASGRAIRAGVTVSEAKDVISMSNSMISTLMKSHEKIVNMARYRAVEQATVDVLRDLDGDSALIEKLEEFHSANKEGDGPLVTAFISALESRLDF